MFSAPHGSPILPIMVAVTWLVGFIGVFLLTKISTKARKPIVFTVTFLAGTYWLLYWLWPEPFNKTPGTIPKNFSESVGFLLQDGVPVVNTVANVLAQLLLGLGVYSILHMHLGKIFRKQKDWGFSAVLLISMFSMTIFGYWDWIQTQSGANITQDITSWGIPQFARDILFDGLLQQMDAAMFSLIAFFIFSAAYRAFRIRSVESTVMLATALLVMFSLMGIAEYASNQWIGSLTNNDPDHFLNNLRLLDLSEWVRSNIERPSIRALEFGLGVGGLAIALRIWLGLDKGGASL